MTLRMATYAKKDEIVFLIVGPVPINMVNIEMARRTLVATLTKVSVALRDTFPYETRYWVPLKSRSITFMTEWFPGAFAPSLFMYSTQFHT